MEKGKALMTTTEASYQNLDLYSSSIPNSSSNSASFHCPVQSSHLRNKASEFGQLMHYRHWEAFGGSHSGVGRDCYQFSCTHKDDLVTAEMAIAAIARRRKLLNDEVIIALADSTWEILDISCSDVSDFGLAKVAEMCSYLRAVDISRCSRITPNGVYQLVQNCHSLEILRCGGCLRSNHTARRCLSFFKPELKNVDGDSWEELDTAQITHGGQSLRWLVWPGIDPDSLETFSSECPRVKVNPQSSPFDFKGVSAPREALSDTVLDDHIVEDIDPSTWASSRPMTRVSPPDSSLSELSLAEKFRLAFVDRDTRLAPKRAKNARQHQRRAEREWMGSAEAKAISLASRAAKSLRGNGRN
ncbi:Protein AMN1-like protein [Bienertia sinuspersici]